MSRIAHAQRRPEVIPGYEDGLQRPVAGFGDAQRRPEVIPGYEVGVIFTGDHERIPAQRRPEVIPGYEPGYPGAGRYRSSTPLNEGRRLSPATSIAVYEVLGRCLARSTKAGGYPRLRADIPG